MDSDMDLSNEPQGEQAMESLGMPGTEGEQSTESAAPETNEHEDETRDPLYVQKRLKQQKRAHEREIRELHEKINSMQAGVAPKQQEPMNNSPYEPGSADDQIHKAVSYALGYKEREERKAKEAQSQEHIAKQYHQLNKHLDDVADKYDDFDDLVRGKDTPFTPHMRDAALMLDLDHKSPGSAGEVLYKLANNRDELERISKLHPLDQAREMVKLSKALIGVGEAKSQQSPKIMGQIKNTPVNSANVINEKTPIRSLRDKMKSGSWK